jgi:hypothetical protein
MLDVKDVIKYTEMELVKRQDRYDLYGTDGSKIASSAKNPFGKLSKQNCDEIFGVVNVDDLGQKHYEVHIKRGHTQEDSLQRKIDFIIGFSKAMELQKDKLFTEKDVRDAYYHGEQDSYMKGGLTKQKEDEYIQSLQQPKEIEVEIVTHVDLAATPVDSRHPDAYLGTDTGIPFLDENGCLILKKL